MSTRRDDLLLSHLHLVKPIAKKIQGELPRGFDIADLVQEGTIGLLQAAESYRGETPFPLYARMRIHGAIMDAIRGERYQWISRTEGMSNVREMPAPSTDLTEQITSALGRLTLRQQRLLELVYLRGLALKEIGETRMLGIGTWAVRKEYHTALDRLTAPAAKKAPTVANVVEMPKAA